MVTLKPSAKTGATTGAGVVIAPILIWIAGLFGVEIPAEVAVLLGGAAAAVVAWLMPAKSGSKIVQLQDDIDLLTADIESDVESDSSFTEAGLDPAGADVDEPESNIDPDEEYVEVESGPKH